VISFSVDHIYVLDLRDDFIMNTDRSLYDFLNNDPVKAFHIGVHLKKWYSLLDRKQQYLYSKSLRHNREEIESYIDQAKWWTNKYPSKDDKQVDMIDYSEYIVNNMIWNDKTEDIDKVKVSLFLGMTTGAHTDGDDEDLIFNVH
jgi:hypothetical protein